jgi:hypothetical protein
MSDNEMMHIEIALGERNPERKHQHSWQNISVAWKHCTSCDKWQAIPRVPLKDRDFTQEICDLEWQLKNELTWRVLFRSLMQYRDRLKKDLKDTTHLDLYIEEMREVRKR